MSIYQCATDGRRITGPANAVYAWISSGGWSSRKRSNYCSDHIGPQLERLGSRCELVYIGEIPQIDLDELPSGCSLCKRQDASYTLFVDAYTRGQDSRTYRARLCDDHVDAAAADVRISL